MDTLHRVKVKNLSNWTTSLRLNSGEVLHLPPYSTADGIPSIEIQGNLEAEKLVGKSRISIHPEEVSSSDPDVALKNEPKHNSGVPLNTQTAAPESVGLETMTSISK